MRLAILATAALADCQFPPTEAEKQRLKDWWSLYRTQSDACASAYWELSQAAEIELGAAAHALAKTAATACDGCARTLSIFGDLPGAGTSEGNTAKNHECGLALSERASAARKAMALIDGDTRASLRLEIVELTKNAGGYNSRCRGDTTARAASLDIPTLELEGLEILNIPTAGGAFRDQRLPDS